MSALIAIGVLVQILGMHWAWRVVTIAGDGMPLWLRLVLIVFWPLTALLVLLGGWQ